MTEKQNIPDLAALRKLEAVLHPNEQELKAKSSRAQRSLTTALWRRMRLVMRRPLVRRSLIGAGAVLGIIVVVFAGLWWRLASGPIEFDLATPWLTAAIADNFGENYKVQVGGSQLERDEGGRIRLRLRDIVVRDSEGAIAASAPKAEVGFVSKSLLSGQIRAERLALVGAEMSVRIEPDGNVTVFAGSDKRPIATASVPSTGPDGDASREPGQHTGPADTSPADASPQKSAIENLTALLAWIDSLGASGLDGHDLAELGLKNGNLTVDDQRNGKRWNFENIDLSLMRAKRRQRGVQGRIRQRRSAVVVVGGGGAGAFRPARILCRSTPRDGKGSVAGAAAWRRPDHGAGPDIGEPACRDRIGWYHPIIPGQDHRRGRLSDGVHGSVSACHRPRRIQSGMGCDAPRAAGAIPDYRRRQPVHALRAY